MNSRKILLALMATILLQINSLLAQSPDSCTIEWSDAIQVSFDSCLSIVPQVVAVGDTVHLLWFGNAFGLCPDTAWSGIIYTHSFDGGRTFSPQVRLENYLNASGSHGLLAVSGRYVYMAYNHERFDTTEYYWLAIRRSTDGGLTWRPRQILTNEFPILAVAAHDSSVYIIYAYVDTTGGGRRGRSACLASHDYGESFQVVAEGLSAFGNYGASAIGQLYATIDEVHYVYQRALPLGGGGYSEIIYTHSTNRGATWSLPDTLSTIDSIGSNHPRISGDENGKISVVWYDWKYGSVDDFHGSVLFRQSSDHGMTWQMEQVLTQRPTAVNPAIVVSGDNIAVAWDDYIDYYRDHSVLRISRNGGRSWCNSVLVNPLGKGLDLSLTGFPLHLVWTDIQEVYYRDAQIPLIEPPIPTSTQILNCYPNPFNNGTTIRYEIAKRDVVTLEIYDLLGRKVADLVKDELKESGSYEVNFEPTALASGIYFNRLKTSTYQETKKMIVIR
jgi:hypothetical protein